MAGADRGGGLEDLLVVVAEEFLEAAPGGRLLLANVVEFLVGPLSSYVTGQDVCVDGGYTKSILSHIPGRPSSAVR